jgi:hypothetical protein
MWRVGLAARHAALSQRCGAKKIKGARMQLDLSGRRALVTGSPLRVDGGVVMSIA